MTAIKIQSPAEFHETRRKFIGGSDAAAALGLSKWKTPYQLYLEKIGEAEPQEETWEMARGKALEPLLRQHYADTTGREVMLPPGALLSEKYPFIGYNPDGLTEDKRLVEFKTAAYGYGWGDEGSDEIPVEYGLQVQHGMIVTGLMVTDVTVSIAGNKPKYFVVEADKELQEMIVEREHEFWHKNVLARIVPEPLTNEDVAMRYRQVNPASIVITETILEDLIQLNAVKEAIKRTEAEKEHHEVSIKSFMGENDTLISSNGKVLATCKQVKGRETLDSAAIKIDHPDVCAKYIKIGEPTRRFLLK